MGRGDGSPLWRGLPTLRQKCTQFNHLLRIPRFQSWEKSSCKIGTIRHFIILLVALWKFLTYPFEPLARFVCRKEKDEEKRDKKEFVCLLICLIVGYAILKSPDMVYTYVMKHHESSEFWMGLYKNYNLIVHLLMLAYGFRWVWGAKDEQ